MEFTLIWNGEASLEYEADLGVIGEAKGKSMAGNFTNKGAGDNHLALEALAIELEVTLELNLEEDKNMGCTLVVGDNSSPRLGLRDFRNGDSILSRILVIVMAKSLDGFP